MSQTEQHIHNCRKQLLVHLYEWQEELADNGSPREQDHADNIARMICRQVILAAGLEDTEGCPLCQH